MASHSINYKMPRARSTANFTVYPFTATDTDIRLQSENHCIIVNLQTGKSLVSKRFAQYPTFAACYPHNGGKVIETPKEITEQLEEILKLPTGNVVSLTG